MKKAQQHLHFLRILNLKANLRAAFYRCSNCDHLVHLFMVCQLNLDMQEGTSKGHQNCPKEKIWAAALWQDTQGIENVHKQTEGQGGNNTERKHITCPPL